MMITLTFVIAILFSIACKGDFVSGTRRRLLPRGGDDHIEFITDIEGQIEPFKNAVRASKIIGFESEGPQPVLRFEKEYEHVGYFVYGGDVVDRGEGDIRITTALVEFKRKYGPRVVFLLGNRDINKLRLRREMLMLSNDSNAEQLLEEFKDYQRPEWDDAQRQKWYDEKIDGFKEAFGTSGSPGPAGRLKWILANTFGAGKSFQNRLAEMQQLNIVEKRKRELHLAETATDDEIVVADFLDRVNPNTGGIMWEYIRLAEFLWISRDRKKLFTHSLWTGSTLQDMQQLHAKWYRQIQEYAVTGPLSFNYHQLHREVYALETRGAKGCYNENIRTLIASESYNKTVASTLKTE
eukprot:321116_1